MMAWWFLKTKTTILEAVIYNPSCFLKKLYLKNVRNGNQIFDCHHCFTPLEIITNHIELQKLRFWLIINMICQNPFVKIVAEINFGDMRDALLKTFVQKLNSTFFYHTAGCFINFKKVSDRLAVRIKRE